MIGRIRFLLRRAGPTNSVTAVLLISITTGADAQGAECMHPLLEAFQFMRGEWTVEAETRLGNGVWERSEARSVIRPLFDGDCVLVEHYTGTRDGRPFTARASIGFNNVNNVLQFEWIDSEHGMLTLFEGGLDGDTIVLDYRMILRGNPVTLRQVFFDIEADSFRHEDRRSNDAGVSWDVSGRARYTRRGQGHGRGGW
jgi:hypothetical protein